MSSVIEYRIINSSVQVCVKKLVFIMLFTTELFSASSMCKQEVCLRFVLEDVVYNQLILAFLIFNQHIFTGNCSNNI